MGYEVLAGLAAALGTTFVLTPRIARMMLKRGITGRDMNKPGRPVIPEMGGIAVLLGFFGGVLTITVLDKLIFRTFTLPTTRLILAALLAALGAAFVGVLDDIFDLRQSVKAALPFFFAIPLGLYAPSSPIDFFGLWQVDLGVWIFLFIPLGVTSAANASNMLEGFNGLGAGMALIIGGALAVISWLRGAGAALFLLLPFIGAVAAFFWYNRYPAKVFPGDTMTLFTGAALASAAIIGGVKEVGFVLFIPMIVEFGLKLKGHFEGECFGKPDRRGCLKYDGPVESLTHVVMKAGRFRETQVVAVLWGVEGIVAAGVVLAMSVPGG